MTTVTERSRTVGLLDRVEPIVRGLVHGNIVIASGAVAVGVATMILVGFPLDPVPLAFVFVAAVFAYTANRFTDRDEDARNLPARARFVRRYGRPLLVLGGIMYVGFIAATAVFAPRMLPVALVPAVGTALYATPLVKRVFVVKNGVVGLVWAMIPLGLGLYYGQLSHIGVLVIAVIVGWHITLAAALFDIKDIHGDRAVGTYTLPVVVGTTRTRRSVAVVAVGLLVPVVWAGLTIDIAYLALGAYPLHLVAVSPFATVDRGPLFYGFVIDGEHLLVAALAAGIA